MAVVMGARQLELYLSKPGAGRVAKAICKGINEAIRLFDKAIVKGDVGQALKIAGEHAGQVASQYSEWGAIDTEPRYHICQAIVDHAKQRVLGSLSEYRGDWGDIVAGSF